MGLEPVRRPGVAWLVGVGMLLGTGCHHVHGGYGHGHEEVVVVQPAPRGSGPPDHAPAHGYRRKYQAPHPTTRHKHPYQAPEPRVEVEMVFDETLGVHVVLGYAGIYFHADRYYRYDGSAWEWTARLGGQWTVVPDRGVPTGLRKLGRGKGPKATQARDGRGSQPPARRGESEPEGKSGKKGKKGHPHAGPPVPLR